MAYPVSSAPFAGAPPTIPYSGTFIPEIWSGKFIEKFYDATVLAAISNTDYEGEIKKYGDKIKIRTVPTITIRDYQADQPLLVERPSAPLVELSIDQGKYFNTVLDDVMARQADVKMMDMWASDASEQMKIIIDAMVLKGMLSGITARNKGTGAGRISQAINLGTNAAPVVLTRNNILDYVVLLGQALDEQNIPETGRWICMPAWATSLMKRSDLRNATITGDSVSVMRNGRLGMVDRFTLYSTNLLPTSVTDGIAGNDADGATHIIAGHKHGMTFASQMTEMETLRSEQTFGTLMRGLQVFGFKVLGDTAVVDLYAKPDPTAMNPAG